MKFDFKATIDGAIHIELENAQAELGDLSVEP